MIRSIAFTAYPCDDVPGTRSWYENVLGLTFAGPYVEDGVERYNEAHLADGCFSLMWSKWVGGLTQQRRTDRSKRGSAHLQDCGVTRPGRQQRYAASEDNIGGENR